MPPKKRGRGRGRGAAQKRIKTEPQDEEPPPKLQKDESFNSKLRRIIKEEEKNKPDNLIYKVDKDVSQYTGGAKTTIHEDYTCMLNQTNIGQNNNKFYVIQLIKSGKEFGVFTKWGRVGEPGQRGCQFFTDVDGAAKAFKKKFTDKTKNNWEARENFNPVSGKYTMIEISQESDDEMEEEEDDKKKATSLVGIKKEPKLKCSLDSRTQLMMKLIFNDEMFMDQMTALNLDVKKMPLGKLSKTQILKGLEVLIDIEKELNGKKNHQTLQNLSSKFYTVVPHSFGRSVPPVINLLSIVDQKKDMMMTLTDIEIAQSLQKEKTEDQSLHPIDMNYQKMGCKLEHIDSKSEDFKMIQKYATACKDTRTGKLLDVWKVDRPSQLARFSQHDDIKYRKLLWHGTNVAVVAAILKAGLRIMPHSGGLVGKGIYFASEHAKSSWYVGIHHSTFEREKNIGFMFLTEVALGKMNFIKQVSSGLRAPPKGFDSVVARGRLEPDPKKDIKKEFEGHDVIVPVGTPVPQKEFKDSGFTQSEYLVYKESQARIRYLLKFSFD